MRVTTSSAKLRSFCCCENQRAFSAAPQATPGVPIG